LVSSSFLRHCDETKTLPKSIPKFCLIGADGGQWQYTHIGLPPYFRKDAFERRVYEAVSRSTPEAARAPFLQAIYESIDEDFKHWDDALAH